MKTFLWLLALAPLLPAQDAKKPPVPIAVTLSDGSVLVSTSDEDALEIRTPYGDQKIPMTQIRTARRLPSGRFLVAAQGLSVSGDLIPREILLNTAVGPLRIPTEELRSISLSSGPGGLLDESTVALWTFPDAIDGTCRDRVKGRLFELHDFDASAESGLVPKKPGAIAAAPSDDDLEFLEQNDYTLELRFKLPKQIRQYAMLLMKVNPADGSQDFSMYVASNGILYIASMRTGNTLQSPANSMKRDAWNTLTFVHKAQGPMATCYLNGKEIVKAAYSMPFGGVPGRGLMLGYNPRWGGGFEIPEAIQYLRISKVARTPAEIEEAARAGEGRFGQAGNGPGVVLRDGSFLRGEFGGLGSPVFRTRFGPLALSERGGGVLKLYKMRLAELEQARTAMRELLLQLGSTQTQEREAATRRLIAYGEAALPVLRDAGSPNDPEIRGRVAALIKKFDENGTSQRPAADLLIHGGLQVQGWLDAESIPLATRRGKLQLALSQVAELHLGRSENRLRPLLRLADQQAFEFDPVEGGKVTVEAGFGRLTVPLEDLKGLSYDDGTQQWTLTTELANATGKISGDAALRTPLGTVTVPMSEVRELKISGER